MQHGARFRLSLVQIMSFIHIRYMWLIVQIYFHRQGWFRRHCKIVDCVRGGMKRSEWLLLAEARARSPDGHLGEIVTPPSIYYIHTGQGWTRSQHKSDIYRAALKGGLQVV